MRQYALITSRPFSVLMEAWNYPSKGVRYRGVDLTRKVTP